METVGFIGLGIMGKPMALNLLKAGYALCVLEKNKAAGELVTAGARSFASSKAIAEQSDIVITMLPDSPEVREVATAKDGVLAGIRKGALYIDMSTVAPSTAIELHALFKEKGVEAVDAPVSGGQVGAESASLSIMAGGSEAAFRRALPLFQAMGKNIIRIGEAGAGQTTKACNQLIVGMTIQAVAEAFTLAAKAGVDLAKMREALLGGFAQSRILDLHGQRIIDGNFAPGFKVKLHRKDMNIVLQMGREHAVPLYGAAQTASHMDALIAQGKGESDHSAIALLLQQLANVE
jgi:2-hydroxy-3-oxopropionate reductase